MFTTDLQQAADKLKNSGVGIFPTDTVWGMGCCVESDDAIAKFYKIKQRDLTKPTAILVGSFEQAARYGVLNDQAKKLIDQHWPGALTVIVPAQPNVTPAILGASNSVGLRFPNFELITQLTRLLECGLVTGSANFSGQPSPFHKSELDPELLKLVDVVVDGECGGQPPSTVVDCTQKDLKIIRQGSVNINNE